MHMSREVIPHELHITLLTLLPNVQAAKEEADTQMQSSDDDDAN